MSPYTSSVEICTNLIFLLLISNKQFLYFIEENPKYEPIIKAILRSYGGIFEAPVSINLVQVLAKAGTYEKEALQLLKELDEQGIITFEFSKHDAQITFLKPREDDHTINPLVPYINQQKSHKEYQISSFLKYVKNDEDCKIHAYSSSGNSHPVLSPAHPRGGDDPQRVLGDSPDSPPRVSARWFVQ